MLVGTAGALPAVLDAYRSGAGVPYAHYGADFRQGQGAINRPVLSHELTGAWLPTLQDLHARLAADPPARVADVGCGVGFSTIALARAYPRAVVTGYDLDAGSIAEASAHAADAGVTVSFARRDAAAVAEDGPFDLVVIAQALHDMARPTDVLASLRRALARGGSLLVAEPRAAERFAAPGELTERLFYGFSIVHCLPAACTDAPSHATGTCIRPDVVQDLAAQAGFARCEVLPIEHPLLRLYRLLG
jgi:2-polyprenyl-3-methyl-5-hydroxy-6-metoxy-1,4-benzoquinol methylase